MPPSPVEELALLDLDRSNKGASKQRRDQINAEIATMRDLLPLPETARQRLSQLQVMSLSCVYIRKCNVLQTLFRDFPAEKDVPTMCDFFQALTGFLLITTREGKLVYISENVTDYLGHSMVDMKTQGDSLYDIVDKRDHGSVQAQLLQGGADPDVTRDVAFFCRMNMSRTLKRQAGFGDVKVMHVRGHFIPLSDHDADGNDQTQPVQQQQPMKYVFMATCSPLITPELKENLIQSNTMVFKTVHQLDMSFLEVTKTAEYHLGFSTEDICRKSWYSMLHPEDIHEAREKHVLLIRSSHEMGCMMTVRMLSADGRVLWVNIVMHVRQAASTQNDDPLIVCINQVISEEEAYQIRMQSHLFTLYPQRSGDMWTGLAAPQGQTTTDTSQRWVTPSTAMTSAPSTAMTPAYSSPAFYQGQRHSLATCTTTYPAMHEPTGYPINAPPTTPSSSSSPPLGLASLPGHTDKLKAMLKRKIQGPCRPAKVPRLSWDEPGANGSHGGMGGMDYAATADPMHSPDSASAAQFMGGDGYCWPGATQVIPRAAYRVAHILPAAIAHQRSIKAPLLQAAPALSPPLSVSAEQVVPESSGVAVPESYLTPDPSPASSPHPHTSSMTGVKAESTESLLPKSVAILQELEKLASLSRLQTTPTSVQATPTSVQATPSTTIATTVANIKKEKTTAAECRHSSRQRELPVMDAFDIESFFDMLGCSQLMTSTTPTESMRLDQAAPVSAATAVTRVPLTAHKPADAQTAHVPVIKQEPQDAELAYASQGFQDMKMRTGQEVVATPQQQGQGQEVMTPPQQQQQGQGMSGNVDASELEELLSFFSGEMTATQLDVSESLMASEVKDEGDTLVESVKAFADTCRPDCHLSSFLLSSAAGLQRPLEEFSPLSGGELHSDVSSDEEAGFDEPIRAGLHLSLKPEGGEKQPPTPPFNPAPHAPSPQDVPGISEEDELYQLDKLLSSMVSVDGMMVPKEPQ